MKPAYAIYVLQVEWSWDHFNTEFATVTVEGCVGSRYQPEYEQLVNPAFPEVEKKGMLAKLKAIAEAIGGNASADCRIVRLYRVEDAVGILNGGQPDKSFLAGGTAMLQMTLRPVCEFDNDGKPVPISVHGEVQASG